MMNNLDNLKPLIQIWRHVSNQRKKQFFYILILSIFSAFFEIVSLGTLLPFIAAMTDPSSIFNISWIKPLLIMLGINSPKEILLPLTIIFCIAVIIAGITRLLLSWLNVRISYATGADLSVMVYNKTLYQPYSAHVSQNSSEIINAVSSKTMGVISGGFLPLITIITSGIIMISIMSSLIFINPKVALSVFMAFTLVYSLIIVFTRNKLNKNGVLIALQSSQLIKTLQEGLGGIRDVLIDGCQDLYTKIFRRSIYPLRRAQANNIFISQSPRFIIESVGITLIAFFAYFLIGKSESFMKALPLLGTLAFGAQRILPIFQLIYNALSTFLGNKPSLNDVANILEKETIDKSYFKVNHLIFKKNIELRNLSFRYSKKNPEVLCNLNLEIKKGSRVGLIGETGSGKSTLLDIIMGLLRPTNGNLYIDGQMIDLKNHHSWQKNIAHVPQNIFLSDSSIEENIAFGVPFKEIDRERVIMAANQAHINKDIEKLPKKYQTLIGERGIKLSGGQRQRIGIARAFYKKSSVIVFDEATSALDSLTEELIMKSIQNLDDNLTLLVIAHRLTTLKNCDKIIEIDKCRIKRIGSYDEIITS